MGQSKETGGLKIEYIGMFCLFFKMGWLLLTGKVWVGHINIITSLGHGANGKIESMLISINKIK